MKNQRPGLRYRPQPGPRAPGLRQSPPAGVGRGLCRCALSLPGSLLAGDRPGLSVLSAPSSSPLAPAPSFAPAGGSSTLGFLCLFLLGCMTCAQTPAHPPTPLSAFSPKDVCSLWWAFKDGGRQVLSVRRLQGAAASVGMARWTLLGEKCFNI